MLKLSFKESGKGQPIILLHGFPFSKKIWEPLAENLATAFRVYTVDLPGFGESPLPPSPFSIQSIGSIVLRWVEEQKIQNSILLGHSLGGYVALSMVDQDPERFAAMVLLHSTALADNSEKKVSRNKTIEFVEKNGAPAFTSNFIPPLFSDKNHGAIEMVKAISIQTSAETVLGYIKAMRDRDDTTAVLKNFPKPCLFIVGKEDPGIPVESILEQARLCQKPDVQILEKVAHMGMFEAEETVAGLIRGFAQKAVQR